MSDPLKSTNIEDVLSSIRRLVSEESRDKATRRQTTDSDKLLLTPAQRVSERAQASVPPEPTQEPAEDGFDFHSIRDAEPPQDGDTADAPQAEMPEETPEDVVSETPEVTDAQPDESIDSAGPGPDDETDATDAAQAPLILDSPADDAPIALDVAPEPTDEPALVEPFVAQAEHRTDDEAGDLAQQDTPPGMADMPEHEAPQADAGAAPDLDDTEFHPLEDRPEAEEIADPQDSPDALKWEDDGNEAPQDPAPDTVNADAAVWSGTLYAAARAHGEDPVQQDARSDETDQAAQAEDPTPQPQPTQQSPASEAEPFDFLAEDDTLIDEDALRELVAEIVREELQGALGERITRNVRKLVRREIHRALSAQDFD